MAGDWIKLHRKIVDWEWYDDTTTFRVFLHCLLKANWKPKRWRGITIERGSFFTSTLHLAEELSVSRQKIRTAISNLQNTNEITIKTTSRGTLITVCKYEEYNSQEKEINQPNNQQLANNLTNEQPTDNQQITITEERKKIEEGKEDKKSLVETPAIAWSATDGWSAITVEDRESWNEAYPACDLDRQLAAMSEWLKSNPAKAKKKNWRRFITNWLSSQQERGGDIRSITAAATPTASRKRETWMIQRELDSAKAELRELREFYKPEGWGEPSLEGKQKISAAKQRVEKLREELGEES